MCEEIAIEGKMREVKGVGGRMQTFDDLRYLEVKEIAEVRKMWKRKFTPNHEEVHGPVNKQHTY